jgi:hypothetical protein
VRILRQRSPGQFDPVLLEALAGCHAEFERIYDELPE